MKTDRNNEYIIGVLGPRHKGNYGLILPGVIKAIDRVKYESEDDKERFVFVHDGVTSGSTGEVVEAVNKTQPSLMTYGYYVSMRKLPLDIELHGKRSHFVWIDTVIDLKPDLLLLFDDGVWPQIGYALDLAEEQGIPVSKIKINPPKDK